MEVHDRESTHVILYLCDTVHFSLYNISCIESTRDINKYLQRMDPTEGIN